MVSGCLRCLGYPERQENLRDGLSTRNNRGEDVAFHSYAQGERDDVEKQEISCLGRGGFAGEDTGLNGGAVSDGLIRVDALSYR
jgi:hypothetical protein